jgi:hypothetical protein
MDDPCNGEGYGAFETSDVMTMYAASSTGYVVLRDSDGAFEVFGTGSPGTEEDPVMIAINVPAAGTWCVWSSDIDGELSGDMWVIRAEDEATTLLSADLTGYEGLLSGRFQESGANEIILGPKPLMHSFNCSFSNVTSLDLSGCDIIRYLNVTDCPMTTITPPPNQTLEEVYASGCDLDVASVNGLFNQCNLSVNGTIQAHGGTNAAPTGTALTVVIPAMDALVTLFNISGAGTAAANDDLTYTMVIATKSSYDGIGGLVSVFWQPTPIPAKWVIATGSGSYANNDDTAEPWEVTSPWTLLGASLPLPTLTAPNPGWSHTQN